jgi:hypothetical protein
MSGNHGFLPSPTQWWHVFVVTVIVLVLVVMAGVMLVH